MKKIAAVFLFTISISVTYGQTVADTAESHFEKGRCAINGGEYDDWGTAIREFTEAIRLNPLYTDAYIHRSRSYFKTDQIDLGNADLAQALKLNPNNPKNAIAYYARARGYDINGDYENAIADYTETIRYEANDESITKFDRAWTYMRRAEAYSVKGDLDGTIADFTEAHNLALHWHYPLLERAKLYFATGKDDLGVADVIKVAGSLSNVYAHRIRGELYLRIEEYDRAIAEYTEQIKFIQGYHSNGWNEIRQNALAYIDRAEAYEAKGDMDNAIADYIKAHNINPDWSSLNKKLDSLKEQGYKVNIDNANNAERHFLPLWVWLIIFVGMAGMCAVLVFLRKNSKQLKQ